MPKYVRGVFVMWKKILLSIGLIILLIVGIEIFNISNNKEKKAENTNIVQNETEISSEYVTDDCVNEWEDYSKTVQEDIKENRLKQEQITKQKEKIEQYLILIKEYAITNFYDTQRKTFTRNLNDKRMDISLLRNSSSI